MDFKKSDFSIKSDFIEKFFYKMSQRYITLTNWSIDVSERSVKVYEKLNSSVQVKYYYIESYELLGDPDLLDLNQPHIKIKCTRFKRNDDEWNECDYIINLNVGSHSFIERKRKYTTFVPMILKDAIGSRLEINLRGTLNNVGERIKSCGKF